MAVVSAVVYCCCESRSQLLMVSKTLDWAVFTHLETLHCSTSAFFGHEVDKCAVFLWQYTDTLQTAKPAPTKLTDLYTTSPNITWVRWKRQSTF